MKVAIISPNILLKRYSAQSTFQMCLAHLWGSWAYRTYFRNRKKLGDEIILDNGAYELQDSISVDHLVYVAKQIRPTYLVLPDSIMNCRQTLERTEKFLEEHVDLSDGTIFVGVPQGVDTKEWQECFVGLQKLWNFECWGVPKVTQLMYEGGRKAACEYVAQKDPTAKMHLLGVWSDPIGEVRSVVHLEQVLSVDTALPVTLGHLASRLEDFLPHPKGESSLSRSDPFSEWTMEQVKRYIRFVESRGKIL